MDHNDPELANQSDSIARDCPPRRFVIPRSSKALLHP